MTRRLLGFARDSRFALAVTVFCGLLAGWLTIGQASALSQSIDQVFLGGKGLTEVSGLLRLMLMIVLLRALLAWGSEVSARHLAVRVKSDLRQRLFEKILDLGPAYTRGERAGELVNTAVEGVEALDAWFSQYLPQLVIAALIPFSILIFIFPRDPLSGLILLITAPLIPLFMYLIGTTAEKITKRQWDTLSRLSAHFLDSLQGLSTLKELGRSKEQADSIAATSDRFRDVTMGVLRVTFLSALVLELVATISTALVAVEVGLRLLYGHLAFQPALFLLLLAPEFYIPLRMLGLRFHAGMAGTSAATRIFEILDFQEQGTANGEQKGEVVEKRMENGHSGDVEPPPFSTLSLSALSYTYPGETEAALKDISLEIQPGEHIGLVGSSGVGKTTLAALLLRFIEPGSGRITLNDKQSNEIPLEYWHGLFAWVPQNPYLFHDTIAANLRLAKPHASDDELQAAARLAHLDEFIQTLPEGYGTMIGEQGARLSAGQAQRLALARAFLKNAPILILDEPTSSLDPQQETLVETSVRTLMQDKIVITIAHRLNTLFHADRILVLEGGRIVESGTHRELISKKGVYARMVEVGGKESLLNTPQVEKQDTQYEFREESFFQDEPVSYFSATRHPSIRAQTCAPHSLSPIPRLLSFLRGSWSWVASSVLLGILTIGSNVGLMGTSAFLISAAALHPALGTLQVAIVGVRFFGIARGIFRYGERLSSHNVTFRLLARLRAWFYRSLEPLAPARLMLYRSGDLLGRIVSDVAALEDFYVRVVSPSLVAVLVAAGMTFFFARYNAGLACSYLGFMLTLGLGIPVLAYALSRRAGVDLIASRSNLQARLVDGIQGLADLIAFGAATGYSQELMDEGHIYGNSQRRLAALTGLSSALTVLLANLGMLSVLVIAIPLVRAGQIPGVMLAVLALIAAAGFEAVMPLPIAAQSLSSSMQAARRLFEIVDAKPAVEDIVEQRKVNGEQRIEKRELFSAFGSSTPYAPDPLLPNYRFTFEHLSFTYPGSTKAALTDISFQLDPGKHIAIVGSSGAGKSTLANLLLRFYDYSQGHLLLDGRDLRLYPQELVRRQFSVLSQRTWFFNDTIRHNLLLAYPLATDSELQQACQNARIDEFILGLPHGYETFIGDRGYRLSGGERQRLGLARALLKVAPVFLLDEPGANLDPPTERRILDTLLSLANKRSLLLITHRLVGLEDMNEIIVLEHGQIVERGTQAGLLAGSGLYKRMWNLQNRMMENMMVEEGEAGS